MKNIKSIALIGTVYGFITAVIAVAATQPQVFTF